MKLNIIKLRDDGYNIIDEFDDDLYVVKGFCPKELCRKSVKKAHLLMRNLPNREERSGALFSFDVLPTTHKQIEFLGQLSSKTSLILH
jgi:hypothetical protein